MTSIFTKIINAEIPCHKVAEDDNFIAFLDINPNAKGHVLCVPKLEINRVFDMTEDHYIQLMQFTRRVAIALEKTVECKRIGVSIIGLEVPHVHVHLIPLNEMKEMTFSHKVSMTSEAFSSLAEEIQANLD